MAHLLVVDDETSARTTLALLLRKRGHRVLEADGVTAATKCLAEEVFDLVVTDLRMPDGDGLDVLRAAKAHAPATEVILLTAYAEWKSAKEAIRLGALDYFEKGQEPDELYHRIDKALAGRALRRENENLRAQLRERYGLAGLIAQSPAMHAVLDLVERVAPTDATLLIQGESGTGKEVIAKAVHHASARAARPFVAVNCGAVPETLLESELFGYMRGAFTGATVNKLGLFEEAARRHPVPGRDRRDARRAPGQAAPRPPERRGAAARRDPARHLRRAGDRGHPRRPRRAHQPGELPRGPLLSAQRDPAGAAAPARSPRGHPGAGRALPRARRRKLGRALRLSPEAVERLLRYPWPGNVRELENAIERAAILARRDTITPEDLPPHVSAGLQLGPSPTLPRQTTLAEAERVQILQTLERFGRNHSGAAEALGIGRTTLWRKLKEYGIDK